MIRLISAQVYQPQRHTRDKPDLFDGPTLVQVGARLHDKAFKQIRQSVQTDSIYYPLYIECKEFAKSVYERKYKHEPYVANMAVREPHDKHSVIVYSLDTAGRVNGTLRLCGDSDVGMPMSDDIQEHISTLRRKGLRIAEPGRFATSSCTSHRLVSAAFEIGCYAGVDLYLMQCRAEHQDFYQSQCAAKELVGYSAPEGCINMVWKIAETPDVFFNRFGSHRESLETLMNELESCHE